jgi:hypothetical protein
VMTGPTRRVNLFPTAAQDRCRLHLYTGLRTQQPGAT